MEGWGEVEFAFDESEYTHAASLLDGMLRAPGDHLVEIVVVASRALRALSRYPEALHLLSFARANQRARARVGVESGEIAWITHDYDYAAQAAREALTCGHKLERARVLFARAERPFLNRNELGPAGHGHVFTHAALYVDKGGNFGDIALPIAVREAIESQAPVQCWQPLHVHQLVEERTLERINQSTALLIGGGGLFLPDTSPNANSGCQWNIPLDAIDRIQVPIGLFAVGFNLFRGQEFRGGLFQRSLEAMVGRASLVGLRNHGSVSRVQGMLPPRLADKIRFLPRPTTILSHIHPAAPSCRCRPTTLGPY